MSYYTLYDSQGHIFEQMEVDFDNLLLNLNGAAGYLEGWFEADEYYVVDNNPVAKPAKPGPLAEFNYNSKVWILHSDKELEKAKNVAVTRVNNIIGDIRSRFVTNIPFQDTTYQAKEKEAVTFLQDDDPDLVNYPYIANEIGITAGNPYEIAQIYVNQAHILHQKNSQLDGVRLGYINQIELCASIDDIDPIMQSFNAAIAELNF